MDENSADAWGSGRVAAAAYNRPDNTAAASALAKSARKLLDGVIADTAPTVDEASQMINVRLQLKLEQIMLAIEGITTPLQRTPLAQIVDHIDDMTRRITEMDDIVRDYMAQYEAAAALDEIPGIARRSAEVILAEIGLDMSRFPSAAHLCSWAGICPGNHQMNVKLVEKQKRAKSVNIYSR